MPIINTFKKEEDNYIIEVEQITTYVLTYYKNNTTTQVATGQILIDTPFTLPILMDGRYVLTLSVTGETDVIHEFYVFKYLQNSIICDAYYILCKGDCNCGNCEDDCVSMAGKKCLKTRNIYVKLLSLQLTYIPNYNSPFSNVFCDYLEQAIQLYKCDIQGKINTLLKEECLYGKGNSTDKLFRVYMFLFWYGMYYLELQEAGNNESEITFIKSKYKYDTILDCLCDLCIDINDLNTIFDNFNPPPSIPVTTNVYAIFDATSLSSSDIIAAKNAVQLWHNEYSSSHPSYTGELYTILTASETYLTYGTTPYTQGINSLVVSGELAALNVLPPNFGTGNGTPDLNALVLCFLDETHSFYHSYRTDHGFDIIDINDGTTILGTQPSTTFTGNYDFFKDTYTNYEYFRGIIYPILKDAEGQDGALILQVMAALEAKVLTQEEIDTYNTTVDVSILLTTNPYTEPLKDYGWVGKLDKIAPASEVFNSTTFNEELNNLL